LGGALSAALLALAGCQPGKPVAVAPSQTASDQRLANAAANPQDWPTHGGTYDEQRFSRLTQIDTNSVERLKLAWYHDLDTNRGQEATPLVVDGRLYTTTAWSKVQALDAATGTLLWAYDPQVPGRFGFSACCDVVNRGPAWYDGKIYLGTLDGRLIALDAETGKPVWSVVTTDQAKPFTITGAPRVVRGKVIIGNGGGEYGIRGYVTAYDAETGAKLWRFYTVPGDPSAPPDREASDSALADIARPSWAGEYWKLGGGGTVWDSIVYDAEFDRLYIGVGNGAPWSGRIRTEDKGDNLFTSSIVALDPDTGRYLWHYQVTPEDVWDFDATQQITLADLPIGGVTRKVLLQASKNGFFYVVDRTDGKLISAENFVPVNWATRIDTATGRPVETPGARFAKAPFVALPGASGAHSWQPMSFSPATGLAYIPAQEVPFLYKDDSGFTPRPGAWNLGIDTLAASPPATPEQRAAVKAALKGRLVAWDPVAQKPAWKVEYPGPWNGGVLSTAGGLVFQGTAGGSFDAYDARTGALLWQFQTQSGIVAGPVSYAVDGRQYVAVVVGYGGGLPLALPDFDGPRPQPNGRVLAFALDGTAALPPFAATLPPPDPGTGQWPPETAARGERLYGLNCLGCHGMGTMSAGVLPDLRRSTALPDAENWRNIVIGGALTDAGMIGFGRYLSADDAEAIRAYVTAEARKLLPTKSKE
jgi:quinohemoprotein ethanol dehydrogenase